MSMPKFPEPNPDFTQEQALTMILSSIACIGQHKIRTVELLCRSLPILSCFEISDNGAVGILTEPAVRQHGIVGQIIGNTFQIGGSQL